ncbi:tRNA pseudouridine(55) synthase TruB [Marinicellulosiphila megalodicopiae]|uniref:tRNA pseudouridine(55) synthase TruB n=1 Tax=Marinicellulosiphila megalodicopiae TaxID=2724896 RepID=UPI003BB16CDD
MGRQRRNRRDIDGVMLVNKPTGFTSNQVLQKIKWMFHANKAGHTGALDPLATGVLPICLGESTKFSQFLLDSDKGYITTAKLGIRTASCDSDSEVTETKPVPQLNEDDIKQLIADNLMGEITQVPPIYSALKVNGVPMYKLARQGVEIEVKSRKTRIDKCEILAIREDEIDLEVHCAKGTYIRSVVDELGQLIGCGAHVSMLHRIKHGHYDINQCITLDELAEIKEKNGETYELLDPLLQRADSPVLGLDAIVLNAQECKTILSGQFVSQDKPLGFYRLIDENTQRFLGLGEITEKHGLKPHRIIRDPQVFCESKSA